MSEEVRVIRCHPPAIGTEFLIRIEKARMKRSVAAELLAGESNGEIVDQIV
jgi:hypothetical protein